MVDILIKLLSTAKELGKVTAVSMGTCGFASLDFVTGNGQKVTISVMQEVEEDA